MDITEKEVSEIVKEVVTRIERSKAAECPLPVRDSISLGSGGMSTASGMSTANGVLFSSMEEAIETAKIAQQKYAVQGLELRRKLISKMREVSRRESENLAKLAFNETGMGRWEDKVEKNLLAANKTPGVEDIQPSAYTGDRGLTLVESAPYGVIGAVTPSTNPSSTIINNAISIIAAGNAAVFAPHPASKDVSRKTMKFLSDAIVSAGGPAGLITGMLEPTIEGAGVLFSHPDIRILLVTGGPAVVRAAMESNKRVIAAGPGNPPVVIDETADMDKAVDSIIKGASFDNGILCTAEKEVLLAGGCENEILKKMRDDKRVYELSATQMDQLAEIVIIEGGRSTAGTMSAAGGVGCKDPVLNRDYVGKNASVLAKIIGLNISDEIRLLWGLVDENHIFMWTEQLMPVLPFAVTGDIKRTIDLAVQMEGGNGHTAIMHSLNVQHLTLMARKSACSIFVKNGPSFMGLGMGEGYASLSIATPTGDGLVRARNFTRPIRCVLVDYFRIV